MPPQTIKTNEFSTIAVQNEYTEICFVFIH